MSEKYTPEDEQYLKEKLAHLRAIQRQKVHLACSCPLCDGELQAFPNGIIYQCSRDFHHWLTVQEIIELSVDDCLTRLKQREKEV